MPVNFIVFEQTHMKAKMGKKHDVRRFMNLLCCIIFSYISDRVVKVKPWGQVKLKCGNKQGVLSSVPIYAINCITKVFY